MKKNEFLNSLKSRLKAFNESEVKSIMDFYDELIEEKKENGLSEEEAIASFGDMNSIVNKVSADLVLTRSNNQTSNPAKNFLIILGICASPILIPIGIALSAVVFSLIVVVFSLLISFLVSGIAVLVALIPMVISMIMSGTAPSIIIMAVGMCLVACAILTYLAILTIQGGKAALQAIIKFFSKRIKNKSEVNKNESN